MASKINRLLTIFIWIFVICLLVYSRFINLGWGLPYPMHPDERNMATAIQQLNCYLPQATLNLPKSLGGEWEPITKWIILSGNFNINKCFNPHFFAYGQFPLYLGYIFAFFLKLFNKSIFTPINFEEATIALRVVSAIASVINVFVLLKIIKLFTDKSRFARSLVALGMTAGVVILSPYAIQFAHFGTTESLLMLFYSLIVYYSLLYIDNKISTRVFIFSSALFSGMALGTKVSSLIFLVVSYFSILFHNKSIAVKKMIASSKAGLYFILYKVTGLFFDLTMLLVLTTLFFILFSPHNLISIKEFIGSMNYESDVALGRYVAFYTRQFINSTPIIFQLEKIFPYVLGVPVFIFGLIGFFVLNWKDKKINLLRIALMSTFLTSAVFFAKWTRFIAPVFPLMTIFSIIFLYKLHSIFLNNIEINSKFKSKKSKVQVKSQNLILFTINFAFCLLTFYLMLPGISYLSVYQKPDIRFQASEWIYKNIPENSYILSETANVVDIPIEVKSQKSKVKSYQIISFDFYGLEENPNLQRELRDHLEKAEYIFVASRRIFANHTCLNNFHPALGGTKCQKLKEKYPQINDYYKKLFSGSLGFEKVAEFESYPAFQFSIFNFQLSIKFQDENAEETWSVFDHPVIRIYKKI